MDDVPATITVLFKQSAQRAFYVAVGAPGPSQFLSPVFSYV
jgi:hypothetical protein